MKRIVFILLIASVILPLSASQSLTSDTTIVVNKQIIEINDSGNRMKVKVYDTTENGDTIERELAFEGHYRNGNFSERTYRHLSLPGNTSTVISSVSKRAWKKNFDPHWSGFAIGFNSFADDNLHINNVSGVSLGVGKSLEYTLNFFEKAFPFARNRFAVVTGLGMGWNRYHLSDNEAFVKQDGVTMIVAPEDGISYSKTRLGVNKFHLPVLLEWQSNRNKNSDFFVSIGAVGVFNYTSASKVKYVDDRGKKQKEKISSDLYVRPLTMDLLVQAGFGDWGLYAKYSPFELFEKDKGPKVHPVSLGMMLHF